MGIENILQIDKTDTYVTTEQLRGMDSEVGCEWLKSIPCFVVFKESTCDDMGTKNMLSIFHSSVSTSGFLIL